MLPGSAQAGLLCSFSPAGDQFALAGPDGRVRVFDTGTGRLLVSLGGPADSGKANGGALANGHLVEAHTCLAWVSTKEKGKKKQAVGVRGVAVGTAAGDVKLYDVQLGQLKWLTVDAVQGGVKALAFSAAQGLVLATGASGSIVSLSVDEGEVKQRFEASKYAITSIALAPDSKQLFGGGSSMQLWDLAQQERTAKYTGHPTEVRAVTFVPGQPHAVSAGSGERHVALWEVPPAKKSKKQHPAVTTLHLEAPAVQLDAACVSEGESFSVGAVSESGEAYVWMCHRDSAAGAGEGDGERGGTGGGGAGLACQLVMRLRVGDGKGKGNDRSLLERCLATSNAAVIANTVARIVPFDAALFLKAAVDRLVSKPNRAVQLVPWIRAVLHHHTAYLMSAPGVQPALTSLFQAIDARVKLHDPLLRLYGRLGLVLHHTRADSGTQAADQQRPGPEVVFEDDLDEEPAAEDPFAPAAVSEEEGDEGSSEEGSSEGDGDDFDAMLADGPGGGDGDDSLGSEDLDDFLDDDD
ncbi:WD repeat domain-containing protein [Tetrabaena socialis]|uniref:WD repeat domain-containing protein n=1 Tax=Tetrabaena socialis TaxID=47790 RepID=A0A2J8AAV1_9CHLO|nr:WD repeat domain-containing protein [Tetrabaena socialis]|eukprot:PNH09593.1 WD repeat domain-containing protein [Tetrabaena socialis]